MKIDAQLVTKAACDNFEIQHMAPGGVMITNQVNIKIVTHETRTNTAEECIPHGEKCTPNIEEFKIVSTAGLRKEVVLYH